MPPRTKPETLSPSLTPPFPGRVSTQQFHERDQIAAAVRYAHEAGHAWSQRLDALCLQPHLWVEDKGGLRVRTMRRAKKPLEAAIRALHPDTLLAALDAYSSPEFLVTAARHTQSMTPELFAKLTESQAGTAGLARNPLLSTWPAPPSAVGEPDSWMERYMEAAFLHLGAKEREAVPRGFGWDWRTDMPSDGLRRIARHATVPPDFLDRLAFYLQDPLPVGVSYLANTRATKVAVPHLRRAPWPAVEAFTAKATHRWIDLVRHDRTLSEWIAPAHASTEHLVRLATGLQRIGLAHRTMDKGDLAEVLIRRHLDRPEVVETLLHRAAPNVRITLAEFDPSRFKAQAVEASVAYAESLPSGVSFIEPIHWIWLKGCDLSEDQLFRLASNTRNNQDRLREIVEHPNATSSLAHRLLAVEGTHRAKIREIVASREEFLIDRDVVDSLFKSRSKAVAYALGAAATPATVGRFVRTYLKAHPDTVIEALEGLDDSCLAILEPKDIAGALSAEDGETRRRAILLLGRIVAGSQPPDPEPRPLRAPRGSSPVRGSR